MVKKAKKKILIVEDEMDMRIFLTTIIKKGGFEPVVAKNGKDGLIKVRQDPPELIILDVMMPDEGGALMYRQLKMDDTIRDIPVIMISGVAKTTFYHYLKMLSAQMELEIPLPNEYIEKPPDPKHLLRTIQRQL